MSSKPPDIGERCHAFEKFGKCSYGASCRFGCSHLTPEFVNVVKEGLYDPQRPGETCNLLPKPLQEALRKRKVVFERSEMYLKRLTTARDSAAGCEEARGRGGTLAGAEEAACPEVEEMVSDRSESVKTSSGAVTDEGNIKLRLCEQKKVILDS